MQPWASFASRSRTAADSSSHNSEDFVKVGTLLLIPAQLGVLKDSYPVSMLVLWEIEKWNPELDQILQANFEVIHLYVP